MDINKLELRLLFEGVFQKYGYDFRNYAPDSARRRVEHFMKAEGLPNVAAVQHEVLHSSDFMERLFKDLSINVTEMFRDPEYFLAVRQRVVPELMVLLDDLGHLKIWHAGCSTGEEVFSMCILMHEEGLLDKSQIYATDFNNKVLTKAKHGIVPIDTMKNNINNYHKAGGKEDFADYYVANYQGARLHKKFSEKIVFSNHNLSTDHSFGEMQVIVCRNVLIYFDRKLQERVFKLFDESLSTGGILCLGSNETLQLSQIYSRYEILSQKRRIYKKISDA